MVTYNNQSKSFSSSRVKFYESEINLPFKTILVRIGFEDSSRNEGLRYESYHVDLRLPIGEVFSAIENKFPKARRVIIGAL